MSTGRLVDQGEEALLDLILAVNYTLHLFKNDVSVADSLTEGDFTEADFTGYSSIALTGGAWVSTQGDPSTGTYAKQTFTSSAGQTPAQTIYGYYITRTSDGALQWFKKFDAAVTVQFNGDEIAVTPGLILVDTGD